MLFADSSCFVFRLTNIMTEQEQQAKILGTNLQQFLQHALDCSNPSCILPLCVNTKLTLQHLQGCKKHKCAICQEMKSLTSKHSESCVDYHCRIPFCMEAKLDTYKRVRIDLSDCLDAILKDNENAEGSTEIERVDIATTAITRGCLESLRKSQERESTPNHTVTAPTSPSVLEPVIGMNSYSPVASSTMVNLSAPFCKTSSIANLPRLFRDQGRGQSSINAATDANDSPWCGYMEPFPASQDSTFTTTNQERATPRSFVVKRNARQNAARNQHVMIGLSSPSPPTRQQNAVSLQVSQNVNKEIQGLILDHSNIGCFSSRAEKGSCSGVTSRAMSFDRCKVRDKKGKNTQTLLKARLFDALCSILRLIKHSRSTEELLMCIRSLKSALHEIKKVR